MNDQDDKKIAEGKAIAQSASPSVASDRSISMAVDTKNKLDTKENKPVDLSKEAWDKSFKATMPGRIAIRVFSRGMMGAAFFQMGGALTKKWLTANPMNHYAYDPTRSLKDQIFGAETNLINKMTGENYRYNGNFLKFTSKVIDQTISYPIEKAVQLVTGSEKIAKRFVTFRPTMYHEPGRMQRISSKPSRFSDTRGRSLGEEVSSVTFDFFMASIGDALGRDLIDLVDPNKKDKPWRDDKGNLDIGKAINSSFKTAWRYLSYNGGEDWAVAVPYVFFMKGQRHLINKFRPGFAYDFDRSLNGNSFKVDHETKEVTGTFLAEGAFDLQTRFTVYNIGTLMYREAYAKVADLIQGKHTHLYGDPNEKRDQSIGDKLTDLAKWTARSAIKGAIYMTPSVPFFWLTRSSQARHRGLLIDQKGNQGGAAMLFRGDPAVDVGDNRAQGVHVSDFYNRETQVADKHLNADHYWGEFKPHYTDPKEAFHRYDKALGKDINPNIIAKINGRDFHPYNFAPSSKNLLGKLVQGVGKINYETSKRVGQFFKKIDKKNTHPFVGGTKKLLGLMEHNPGGPPKFESSENFGHRMTDASFSYTPYMTAKAEFANLFDTGQMDVAVERLEEGLFHLNLGEVKAGLGEVWNTILQKPLADPQRDAIAQHRIQVDSSAADNAYDVQRQKQVKKATDRVTHASSAVEMKPLAKDQSATSRYGITPKQEQKLDWREKMHKGRDEDGEHVISTKHAPMSHAEREAMRKEFEAAQPPTNSLH